MENTENNNSILDMCEGGVLEIINRNVQDMLVNIMDPNTDLAKRTLTVKVHFKPKDNTRKKIDVAYHVDAKLSPINPVATSIITGFTQDGELQAVELQEIPGGQMKFDGSETPQPVVINFPKAKVE